MTQPVILVEGVSKQFSLSRRSGAGAWWRTLTGSPNLPNDQQGQQVLDDVSLSVSRGDAIAILGENGAGKSTLLKIIAGIIRPDQGSVSKSASVGAMLELGAGFDDQLTGRENALAACQLAGLSAKRAQSSIAQIGSFAELGSALDEPVGHYSSGMVVRLGFAVMTATCPDVLISDEVLAVGDESFQKKCIAWVEGYLSDGGTLLLVSHSLYHVQRLCSKAIWLHQGAIRVSGDVFSVSQQYLAYHEKKLDSACLDVDIDAVSLEKLELQLSTDTGWTDSSIEVCADLMCNDGSEPPPSTQLVWQLGRLDGAVISGGSVAYSSTIRWKMFLPGTWLPGNLRLDVWPANAQGQRLGRAMRRMIKINGKAREFGILRLPHRWLAND